METYLTETGGNSRYHVKVMHHDGKVVASGNFSTMSMAHQWIDKRRSETAAVVETRRPVLLASPVLATR